MFRTTLAVGVLSLLTGESTLAQSAISWHPEFIDSPYQMTVPVAINNRGQVVGSVGNTGTMAGYNVFIWSPQDGFRILAENAIAADINDRGDVAGSWLDCFTTPTGGGCTYRGFIWDANSGFRDLGTFSPNAMNNRGDMAGSCFNATYTAGWACALYRNGETTRWDCEVAKQPCGAFAVGINERGDVVGSFYYFDYPSDAMLWPRRGDPVALEVGTDSYALDINNAGTVTGTANAVTAAVWRKHGQRRLIPETGFLQAVAINASGVVVGRELDYPNQAFVWDSKHGGFRYLAPNAFASEATDINNRGDIVGFIDENNTYRGVIWQARLAHDQETANVF